MIVTTEMTAATPTTMPINVSAVRSLLARRLAVATRKASQIFWPRKSTKSTKQNFTASSLFYAFCAFSWLSDSFVFLDLTVADRDHAVRAFGDVMFVRHYDDGVAFGVETLEEVHDFHARV